MRPAQRAAAAAAFCGALAARAGGPRADVCSYELELAGGGVATLQAPFGPGDRPDTRAAALDLLEAVPRGLLHPLEPAAGDPLLAAGGPARDADALQRAVRVSCPGQGAQLLEEFFLDPAGRRGPALAAGAAAACEAFLRSNRSDARRGRGVLGRSPQEASDFVRWLACYGGGRLVHKWAHYLDVYERHLARFHSKPVVRMLEMGLGLGGSLRMWADYFGPRLVLHGLDINPSCKVLQDRARRVYIHIGSQGNRTFLQELAEKLGPLDIVLDDASHESEHMRNAFEAFYPRMHPHGVYIVEDVSETYSEGVQSPFVEYAHRVVNKLNAYSTEQFGWDAPDTATRTTHSVAFYDSMVVFERRPRRRPVALVRGDRTFSSDEVYRSRVT